MAWLPLNHGLGKVLYSLTLAPCEAVRIAVVDWTRDEAAVRNERTGLTEDLTHSLRRDRTIEEVVNAVLREHQSGDSFMGGTAGVGGYGGGFGGGGMGMPGMPGGGSNGGPTGGGSEGGGGAGQSGGGGGGQQAGQNWGVTGSHSIGYAMASSSGNRDVDVDTTQTLVDEISQASHLARDLRSTVIVQSNQRESEIVQARIVRNHNHSHALTVLYYEVVRHYLVRTLHTLTRPAIFIKYPVVEFDRETIRKQKNTLRPHLLDPKFDSLLSNWEEFSDNDQNLSQVIKQGFISKLLVRVTGGNDHLGAPERLWLLLLTRRGEIKRLNFRDNSASPHYAGNEAYQEHTVITRIFDFSSAPDFQGLSLNEVSEIGLTFNKEGGLGGEERFQFHRMEIKAVVTFEDITSLVDVFDYPEIPSERSWQEDSEWWKIPNKIPEESAENVRKVQLVKDFLDHLNANKLHYNAALWLNENPNERAVRFANYSFNSKPLVESIENKPVQIVGDYVVFPLTQSMREEPSKPETLRERIVGLPTRGAFAEAKLSHCNASEVIDDTRFWDWQISPCPDDPTEIAPITMGSRRSPFDVSPSSFPTSGVGITDPPTAPEPFGMREVMELLRTPDIFRDMSGIEQLGSLLQKLVEVAGEVEKSRIGATTQLATAGREASQNQMSGQQQRPSASTSTSGSTALTPRDRQAQGQIAQRQIEQARSRGAISDGQANDLIYRSFDNLFTGSSQNDNFSEQPAVQRLIESGIAGGGNVSLNEGDNSLQIQRVNRTIQGDISFWESLIRFSVPEDITRELTERNMQAQSVQGANYLGAINLDFYPVRITRMPTIDGRILDAPTLLRYIRNNINRVIDTDYGEWYPYERGRDDNRYFSSTPLGSVMGINIYGPDNAAVVVSFVDNQRWIFTTVTTPNTGRHPVSGNREFGIFERTPGEFIFYTRGADRPTNLPETFSGMMGDFAWSPLSPFAEADGLWRSLQAGIVQLVRENSGNATIISPHSQRYPWSQVLSLPSFLHIG